MAFSGRIINGVLSIVKDVHGGFKEEIGTVHKEEICDGCGKPGVLIIDTFGGEDEFMCCPDCLRGIAAIIDRELRHEDVDGQS